MVRILLPDRPSDDVAFLIARTRALSSDCVAAWEVSAEPSAVHEAREKSVSQLRVWGMQAAAFTTELIVSELVTNAIRHASGPISLRLIREHVLICEVSDTSSTSPHMRRASGTEEEVADCSWSRRWPNAGGPATQPTVRRFGPNSRCPLLPDRPAA